MATKPIPTTRLTQLNYLINRPFGAPSIPIMVDVYRTYMDRKDYERREETDFIAVHCADTPQDMKGDIADIRGWHMTERGWSDVGYHYVILPDGTIQTGRPVWSEGAGAKGYNSRSVHICLWGGKLPLGFAEKKNHPVYMETTADELYTQVQLHALRFLLANLKKHLYPTADIRGHRDYAVVEKGKTCPNFDVRKWLAQQNLGAYEVNLSGSFWN